MLSAAVGVGEGPQAKARQRMCKRDLEIVHDVFWDRDAKSRCVANGKLKGRVRDDRRRAHHTVSLLRSLVFDCSCLALSLPLLDFCAFAYRAFCFVLSFLPALLSPSLCLTLFIRVLPLQLSVFAASSSPPPRRSLSLASPQCP